jgi:hypothetical protein
MKPLFVEKNKNANKINEEYYEGMNNLLKNYLIPNLKNISHPRVIILCLE